MPAKRRWPTLHELELFGLLREAAESYRLAGVDDVVDWAERVDQGECFPLIPEEHHLAFVAAFWRWARAAFPELRRQVQE
jgi:hypothetical protein